MDKLTLKTKNLADENIAKLSALFPEVITEVEKDGKIIKTINSDKLKELIGDYADNSDEFYELSWVGKQRSRQKIVMPITKTLRPVVEDSVDFENTENLYIEGDNFEVLKLLQESYLNKIKMIYIDPPYNTGKDFIYKDNFAMSREEYNDETGSIDDEGNKLFKNTTTNGRFHSDWLSMMFERLVIAKDLLRDDGVIFISIDDNEQANLKRLCDEIFGESNFVSNIVWQSRTSISDDHEISMNHNHTVIYARNYENLKFYGEKLDESEYQNRDNDSRGPWKLVPLDANKPGGNTIYPILNPKTNIEYNPPEGRSWAINPNEYKKLFDDNRISFGLGGDSAPKKKLFLHERLEKGNTKTPSSILTNCGTTKDGSAEITDLFVKKKIFSYPKPTSFLSKLIQFGIYQEKSQTILDFFSGSATTAHAVMQLNAEDGGNRKFIMVQLPEPTAEDSEAFKAGYKNICEIGKERIRRAARKIQDELKDKQKQQTLDEAGKDTSKLDFGFRVFRTDSSNMKDVYYNPRDIDQRTLTNFRDNIKEDRTDKDILYQVLLELAIPISAKIKEEKANNKTIYRVNNNFLIACFDNEVDLETIKKIAELNPLRIVFKDSSFEDDAAKVNCGEYLKNKLPNTIVKVI